MNDFNNPDLSGNQESQTDKQQSSNGQQEYQQSNGQQQYQQQQYQQPNGQQQYQQPNGQQQYQQQQYQQPNGQQQYQQQPPPYNQSYIYNAKSKVAAGVLGILLGSLGIHNFYLGYTGKAVAQLLITVLTCGFGAIASGVWGLIEGIMILTGSIAVDGQGLPLRD